MSEVTPGGEEKGFEVVKVDNPSEISDEVRQRLVKNLVSFTFLPDDGVSDDIRRRIEDALEDPTGEKIREIDDEQSAGYTLTEIMEGNAASIRNLMEKGQMFAGKINGETVAIAAVKEVGHMPDGREILEVSKVSALPEYQGKHLGSKIMDATIKTLMAQNPDAVITTASANPKVINHFRKRGWDEVGWGEDSEMGRLLSGTEPDSSNTKWQSEWQKMRDRGYRCLYWDPKEGEDTKEREAREMEKKKKGEAHLARLKNALHPPSIFTRAGRKIREVVKRRGNKQKEKEKEEKEREEEYRGFARHEGGHLIIDILNSRKVIGYNLNPGEEDKWGGKVTAENMEEDYALDTGVSKEKIVRRAAGLLGGMAHEAALIIKRHNVDDTFEDMASVVGDYRVVEEELSNNPEIKAGAREILKPIYEEVVQFFRDKEVQKAMKVLEEHMAQEVVQEDEENGINGDIKSLLEEKGILFEGIQTKYEEVLKRAMERIKLQ